MRATGELFASYSLWRCAIRAQRIIEEKRKKKSAQADFFTETKNSCDGVVYPSGSVLFYFVNFFGKKFTNLFFIRLRLDTWGHRARAVEGVAKGREGGTSSTAGGPPPGE